MHRSSEDDWRAADLLNDWPNREKYLRGADVPHFQYLQPWQGAHNHTITVTGITTDSGSGTYIVPGAYAYAASSAVATPTPTPPPTEVGLLRARVAKVCAAAA